MTRAEMTRGRVPGFPEWAEGVDAAEPITTSIARRLSRELRNMEDLIGDEANSLLFDTIKVEAGSALQEIGRLILEGKVLPWHALRLSRDVSNLQQYPRALRVGILPLAADPFHWMHLLIGLKAIVRYELDKVVYVISGSDPRKPNLLRANIRHRIGQGILRLFSPLFAYSSIALGEALDGEVNIFRILQLNPRQRMDAFYIAGTDHYHRFNPATGMPDTIAKLEKGIREKIYSYDGAMHSISALFIVRGGRMPTSIDTFLDIGTIPRTPFETSSTSIRKALAGGASSEYLVGLPYSAFVDIKAHGLYTSSAGTGQPWLPTPGSILIPLLSPDFG